MGRVADEKDSAATELIGDLFGGLPRSDVHNFHVDWRPDGCEQHLAAALRCELVNGFTPTRKVGGRKNTEVVFGHNEYSVDVRIGDLDTVAVAQVGDELTPRRAKIHKDNEDRQPAEARCADAQLLPNRAVGAVGGH